MGAKGLGWTPRWEVKLVEPSTCQTMLPGRLLGPARGRSPPRPSLWTSELLFPLKTPTSNPSHFEVETLLSRDFIRQLLFGPWRAGPCIFPSARGRLRGCGMIESTNKECGKTSVPRALHAGDGPLGSDPDPWCLSKPQARAPLCPSWAGVGVVPHRSSCSQKGQTKGHEGSEALYSSPDLCRRETSFRRENTLAFVPGPGVILAPDVREFRHGD